MSDHEQPDPNAPAAEPSIEKKPTPKWVYALFAIAVLLVIAGLIGVFVEEGAPSSSAGRGTGAGPLASSFGPNGEPIDNGTEGSSTKTWSPAFLKLGFSFFVAFAVGYALRTFLKIALLGSGVIVLAVLGLQQLGVITELNWQPLEKLYDSFVGNIGDQFSSLKSALTGSLPQAGLAVAGLLAGLRKG